MCPACGERLRSTDCGVCEDCWQRIRTPRRPLCPRCGLGEPPPNRRCPGCLRTEVFFTAARQAALFEEPMSTLVQALKYRGVAELADPFARLAALVLVRDFPGERWDVIVPVPLHRVRRRDRGYNQSALIARRLGALTGWPVDERLAVRHRWTQSQTFLSRRQRLTNVEGAFRCPDPARAAGPRILLVDDVHTTGSTINETARALREAGAAEVFALAVARATDTLAC
jgi:ComF family protein